MRTSIVVLLLCSVALLAGIVGHLSGKSRVPDSPAVAESGADPARTPSPRIVAPMETWPNPAPQMPDTAAQAPLPTPSPGDAEFAPPVEVEPRSTAFSQAMDTLVSTGTRFDQKQAVWRALQDSGQLDEAIEALKQGAAENPASAGYPAALGQAQLYKAGEVSRSGGSLSEMGLLGMQADQNFDAALELEPTHWEAQFFKAVAMSHWPLELNKGDEVIQRLSGLIDQQEVLPPQPQFAQTYVVLGEHYLRMGRPDYAAATWQLGVQRFPGDVVLQQKSKDP